MLSFFPPEKHKVLDEELCEASLLESRILILKIENYHGSNKKKMAQ